MSEPGATLRQFCGTYPVLIGVHNSDGDLDERRLAFAQALETQCPLDEVAEACRSLASGARVAAGDAQGEPTPIDPDAIRAMISAGLSPAEYEIETAASAFTEDLAAGH